MQCIAHIKLPALLSSTVSCAYVFADVKEYLFAHNPFHSPRKDVVVVVVVVVVFFMQLLCLEIHT